MMKRWIALGCAALTAAAAAVPFVPADDAQVLERLPERGGDALALHRKAWRAAPASVDAVAAFARRAIDAYRADGDLRYLGEAQAALKPWEAIEPPSALLLLRATVRQSLHDFPRALADLDALLAREPRNAQARLTRATVRNVVARHAEAIADCDALAGLASPLVAAACRADVAGRSGRAREALDLLEAALRGGSEVPAVRAWAATIAGELAARLGETDAAERHFRAALALAPADAYALGAYADLLLDAGRAEDAVALLASRTRHDALLLRYVIALERSRRPVAQARRALEERIDAARRRGDNVHLREASRFALAVQRDPAHALALARANWALQREPADLRVLAEAAMASGDRATLRGVRAWLRETGLEDARMQALLQGGT